MLPGSCVLYMRLYQPTLRSIMGIKQVLVDDLTGEELPSETKPMTVTVDGKKHEVYLSAKSSERLMDMLTGVAPLLNGHKAPAAAASSSTGSRSKTETYGYDYAEVKTWAIANGIKAKNGNPVTEKTPRIGQDVYDAYKAAQDK